MARPTQYTVHPATHILAHGRSRGGQGVRTHPTPGKPQGGKVSLEILVRTLSRSNWTPGVGSYGHL